MSEKHNELAGREVVLRADLAEAIKAKQTADSKVSEAQDRVARCKQLLDTAESEVFQLETLAEETAAKITHEEVGKIVAGIKKRVNFLSLPAMELPDARALDCARSTASMIKSAYDILTAEHDSAKVEAIRVTDTIKRLIDNLLDLEAEKVANEVIADHNALQEKLNVLRGMCEIDLQRPGGQKLNQLQERVAQALENDPYKLAIAEGFDISNWKEHLQKQVRAKQPLWAAYAARLATDAHAKFEKESHQ